MKKVILNNGTELDILECYGSKEYFRDVLRDTLEFRIDPAIMTLDEADSLFSAENCVTITIIENIDGEVILEDGTSIADTQTYEFVHENYTIRISITKREEKISNPDGTVEMKDVICCKMGQKSEADMLQMELDATKAAYDDLVLEYLGV